MINKMLKTFISFFVVILVCCNFTEVKATNTTSSLLKLTSTAQETDYYVKIGSTTYNINTTSTLADATFALLRWEAKGSEDTKSVVGNFNGVSYSGFNKVYTVVYDLLLKSATKTFESGSALSTSTGVSISGTAIWKIAGTVTTPTEYITSGANAKLIIVSEKSATVQYGKASRINIGRETDATPGQIAFLGRSESYKISLIGSGTSTAHTKSPLIVKRGDLYLNNTIIKDFYFTSSSNCAINFPSGHDAARYLYMSNSSMNNVVGTYSPGIFCRAYITDGTNVENAKSKLYIYDSSFLNCQVKNSSSTSNISSTNGGAAIRSYAADNCALRAEKCNFENNVAGTGTKKDKITASGGGAIYWKSVANSASLIECTFIQNSTTSTGGAVYNTGKMEIKGCTFENNNANYGGGAIAVEPPVTNEAYDSIDVTNLVGTLTLDKDTVIVNNKSGIYGGGVFFNAIKAQIATPIENYEMELIVNGTDFTNNQSEQCGGAIAMRLDYGDFDYKTGIIINENSIFTENTSEDNGGAIWMGNTATCDCNLTDGVVMNGGTLEKNTAQDGGAICIESNKAGVSMNFLMNNGSIKSNNALNNGGAIYLSGGDFTINGGNIGEIENDKKIGNKAIQGGAVYVTGGNFTMNGGTIKGNTATNSGGAIQINDGNVYITAGKITSNVARGEDESANVGYGGGIYVDGGEIVRITGGEISNNIAAKNGGGIEVKTNKVVTVDIDSGSFIDNVADECGGAVGIECDNGTINVGKVDCDGSSTSDHVHPELSGNLAGVQGGGFYMTGRDAKLNIYCGGVDNNIVVDMENNFDQSSGTVTVYEGVQIGTSNEGIIVIGGTFIDKRTQGEESYNITYYCNYNGSTDYREALITKGTTITLPGDIFGIDEYEIIGWTRDKNNTTEIEYTAGQTIELMESITLYAIWILEEKNESSYVVVIPTNLSFSNDTETKTFDIKASLTLFPRNRMLNIIVSDDEFALKLLENGVEKDKVKYELTNEKKKINPGDVVASFGSDSALVTFEGREELSITVIDNPKYIGYYQGIVSFRIEVEEI